MQASIEDGIGNPEVVLAPDTERGTAILEGDNRTASSFDVALTAAALGGVERQVDTTNRESRLPTPPRLPLVEGGEQQFVAAGGHEQPQHAILTALAFRRREGLVDDRPAFNETPRLPVGVAEDLEPGAAKKLLAGGVFQEGRLLALELGAVILEQVLRPCG